MSDEASEAPADPPPWQPPGYPPPPVYGPPPGWQPPPPPYAAPPGWQPPPYAPPPGWQPAPYGAPPAAAETGWHSVGPTVGGYPQPVVGGYPPPGAPQPYGYPQPRSTNGFAIASICCSVAGILLWVVGPVLGLTFGIIALRATADRRQRGRSWAIAGIVVGALMLVLNVAEIVAAVHGHTTGSHNTGGFDT